MTTNKIVLMNLDMSIKFSGLYANLIKIYIDIITDDFLLLNFRKILTQETQTRTL